MKEVTTEITIKSTPENIWNALKDLSTWKEWNPTVLDITGEAKLGSKLKVTMKGMGGKPNAVLNPIISQIEDQKNLTWTLSMGAGLLFKYVKIIELEKLSEGTKLTNKELYGGLIPTLFWGSFKNLIQPTLSSMNNGLKRKLEK